MFNALGRCDLRSGFPYVTNGDARKSFRLPKIFFSISFLIFFSTAGTGLSAENNQVVPPDKSKPSEKTGTPSSLDAVFGTGGAKTGYVPRLAAVRNLGGNLKESEIQALLSFLQKKLADEPELDELQLGAIKNETANLLVGKIRPAHFGIQLISMYNDKSMDMTWRNYCIQFLGDWCAMTSDPEEKSAVVTTLRAALSDRDSSMAGTALLSLSRVPAADFSRKDLSDAALKMALDGKNGAPARIAALQICSITANREVLDCARKLAESGENVPLRVAAIAAVGSLGGPSDMELLKKLSESTDKRLSTSSKAAAAKLSGEDKTPKKKKKDNAD